MKVRENKANERTGEASEGSVYALLTAPLAPEACAAVMNKVLNIAKQWWNRLDRSEKQRYVID